jgi:hypothetical protein
MECAFSNEVKALRESVSFSAPPRIPTSARKALSLSVAGSALPRNTSKPPPRRTCRSNKTMRLGSRFCGSTHTTTPLAGSAEAVTSRSSITRTANSLSAVPRGLSAFST